MSLRLLIDEDTQATILVDLLRRAGHDVLTAGEAGLGSSPDPIVLSYARQELRTLLTQNCSDFRALHDLDPQHSGIIAIFHDHISSKNMTYMTIVKAIANLEASGWELTGQFVVLNAWNF